jgi:hypothetical protein
VPVRLSGERSEAAIERRYVRSGPPVERRVAALRPASERSERCGNCLVMRRPVRSVLSDNLRLTRISTDSCHSRSRTKQPQSFPCVAITTHRPSDGNLMPDGKKYSLSASGTRVREFDTGYATFELANRMVSDDIPIRMPRTSKSILGTPCSGAHQIFLWPSPLRIGPVTSAPITNSPDRAGPLPLGLTQRLSTLPCISDAWKAFGRGSDGVSLLMNADPSRSAHSTISFSPAP